MVAKNIYSVILLSSLLILGGCGTPTPYQPRTATTGGFSERRIDDSTYFVQFIANGHTSLETARKYLLYRCAELTKQAGYENFATVSSAFASDTAATHVLVDGGVFDHAMMHKVVMIPIPIIIPGGGGHNTTVTLPPSVDIRMFNDDTIKQRMVGWNAQEVLNQLGPLVHDSGELSAAWPQAWVFEPGHVKIRATDTPTFGVPVTVRPPQA